MSDYSEVAIKYFLLILLSLNLNAQSIELTKFESDFCTYFPEGTKEEPALWKDCCYEHDLRYWFGGTQEDMDLSDTRLRACVTQKAGKFYGDMMYYGVRAGHHSPVKSKTQWSWGWKNKRETKAPLETEELEVINAALDQLELGPDFLKEFRIFYSL